MVYTLAPPDAPAATPALLSTHDVLARVSCSQRQLDWWIRTGVIRPEVAAAGYGTRRAFTMEQCRLVGFVVRMTVHGAANLERWAKAVADIEADLRLWAEVVIVTAEGRVRRAAATSEDGPRVDLIDVALHVERDLGAVCGCRVCTLERGHGRG